MSVTTLRDVDERVVAQPLGEVGRPAVDPRLAVVEDRRRRSGRSEAADERQREQRRQLEAEVAGRDAVAAEAGGEVGDRAAGLEQQVPDRAGDLRDAASSRGWSSRSSIKSRTFARASGLRRRWISATIPPIEHDQRAEREQPARDVGRELVDRAPEHEAERAERDRPQAGGEHVVGQEARAAASATRRR